MTDAAGLSSGKGHRDENFPVASRLVRAELRPAVLAFYRFARTADDVADHASAEAGQKLLLLDRLEAGLGGDPTGAPEGLALRLALAARSLSDRHALDLLKAFRRDVTQLRYADWDELMDYCRYSAAPVGRFVLDLHGEPRALWPANDALCAALQVINHLQDCAKDYREIDRVYLPQDTLAAHGLATPDLAVEALAAPRASAALRSVIAGLADRTRGLLEESRPFANGIADRRLALEVGVIQSLADSLVLRLMRRDPLSERVHHRAAEAAGLALRGVLRVASHRTLRLVSPRRAGLQGGRG
jgi:squalene synthase HpnC